jgi:hypothetical protein
MGFVRRRLRLNMQVRNVVVVVAGILLQKENDHQAMASIQNGVCDLDCPVNIGAKCAFGESPYLLDSSMSPPISSSTTTPTSLNGMHCTCPDSYTGIQCEFSFDSCNDNNLHVCYHGGICKSGAVDTYGNVQHYCDCSKTVDATTKLPYVGKYCELATALTCDDSNDPNPLCFNGGICNQKYPYVICCHLYSFWLLGRMYYLTFHHFIYLCKPYSYVKEFRRPMFMLRWT